MTFMSCLVRWGRTQLATEPESGVAVGCSSCRYGFDATECSAGIKSCCESFLEGLVGVIYLSAAETLLTF